MIKQDVFFKVLDEKTEKLNSYLFKYYQNSQEIKQKILNCRTIEELENICLFLEDSEEKAKIEWLFTSGIFDTIKRLPDLSDEFLTKLKLLILSPKKITKLTHYYNRETGKIEPIDE